MEQGRLATLAALGQTPPSQPVHYPYAIHTIPEISFVGPNEQELARNAAPYVVGLARYQDLARSELEGERRGLLKLLVDADTEQLLGAHIFGTSAAELVHLGQAAIAAGLTLDYFVETPFNAPTFTHAYKVAASDAQKRLRTSALP